MANEINGLSQPTLRQVITQPGITPPPGEPLDQGAAASGSSAASDRVTLTNQAQLLQKLEASVADQPAVDQARIDRIKQQISSGQYIVNADRIAQQLTALEGEVTTAPGGIQRDVGVTRTQDGYSVTINATGPHGHRNRSTAVTTSYDAATQTLSRDTTVTGTNGQQIARHGEVSRTEEGLVGSRDTTVTGTNGLQITRHGEVSRTDEGLVGSRDTTVTGTNGQQITRHGEVSRTDEGVVRSITATGPDGNTVTVTTKRPYDNPGVSG